MDCSRKLRSWLWIVFKRDMVIQLKQELIRNSFKTIDGRGVNVHIANGGCITIQFVTNVIIHGLHIHDCKPTGNAMVRSYPTHFGWRTIAEGDAKHRMQPDLTDECLGSNGSRFRHVTDISADRIEAFKSALGKHMHAQHLEHISIGDVEGVVNNQAVAPYSRAEVMLLLEKMQDEGKLMLAGDLVYNIP